jgi:hypothetical protein
MLAHSLDWIRNLAVFSLSHFLLGHPPPCGRTILVAKENVKKEKKETAKELI